MSVTFTTATPKSLGWTVETWCDTPVAYGLDRTEAEKIAAEHDRDCDTCADNGGTYAHEKHDAPAVQMANANAREVLGLLGLEDRICGTIDAADLRGRALHAEDTLEATHAIPPREERHEGRATIVHGGRDAGYLETRLSELIDLSIHAERTGDSIVWG